MQSHAVDLAFYARPLQGHKRLGDFGPLSWGGSVWEFADEVKAYLARKNEELKSINWQTTNEKAWIKLKSIYPTI